MPLSDLIRDVKNNATNFINNKKFLRGKFSWQEGYGAFSYSHAQLDTVYQYILESGRASLKRKTFKEEYLDLLQKFEIEYDETYLFEWIE